MKQLAVVVTTINYPTKSLSELSKKCSNLNCDLIIVGDQKTPGNFELYGARYIPPAEQDRTFGNLSGIIPWNSYSRKMMGYLYAIKQGASTILETDDDNLPYDNFLTKLETPIQVLELHQNSKWVNCYKFFTNETIWPRGFPLEELSFDSTNYLLSEGSIHSPYILQSLADGDPDVDAIWRLTRQTSKQIKFKSSTSLAIASNQYSPFNSQATTWPKELFILMYLPITCSFRMTDIWRSFIAQRVMREIGARLVFESPRVFQERNPHNLVNDLEQEVEGYINYSKFVKTLDNLKLENLANRKDLMLKNIYQTLIEEGFFNELELIALNSWITTHNLMMGEKI